MRRVALAHVSASDVDTKLENLQMLLMMIDDFDLRGEPARAALVDAASRIPTDSRPPELARARAAVESTTPQLG